MSNPVSQDKIEQFCAITGADTVTATTFLGGASGDADRAVNDYFDNPNKYTNQNVYDESAWHTDRTGDVGGMGYAPAFNIETYEGREWNPGIRSIAPSRPPSRTSNAGSMSSTRGIADTSSNQTWEMQETGVTHGPHLPGQSHMSGGTQHGSSLQPATRSHYDESQWSVTLHSDTTQSVTEVLPDPRPTKRRRKEGQPVLMKPLANNDLLPALITIMYAIPLARRALLFDDSLLNDYGFDPSWWQGTCIRAPMLRTSSSLSEDSGFAEELDSLSSAERHDKTEIIREVQRLIAFQADSQRSYGSVDALATILQQGGRLSNAKGQSFCDKFLVQWESAAAALIPNLFEDHHLFRSTVYQSSSSPGLSGPEHFYCLDVSLGRSVNGEAQTLYEALDAMIWTDLSYDQFIVNVAPVLVVKVSQLDASSSGLDMDIPATWYVDRYLRENFEETKHMRREVVACHSMLNHLELKKHDLENTILPRSGTTIKVSDMLATAKAAFNKPNRRPLDDDDAESEDAEAAAASATEEEAFFPPSKPDVVEQLEAIARHVQGKVDRLEQEQARLRRQLRQHAEFLTAPGTPGPGSNARTQPKHRYSLCGAAIDSHTMFVLHRAHPALIDMSSDSTPATDQWWRFGYANDGSVSKQPSTEEVALGAASSGGRNVLLVYASDAAVDPRQLEGFSVPEALRRFVEKDNEVFAKEVEQEFASGAQEIAPLTGWEPHPGADVGAGVDGVGADEASGEFAGGIDQAMGLGGQGMVLDGASPPPPVPSNKRTHEGLPVGAPVAGQQQQQEQEQQASTQPSGLGQGEAGRDGLGDAHMVDVAGDGQSPKQNMDVDVGGGGPADDKAETAQHKEFA